MQDETRLPKHQKFCNYCNKWYHTKQECFKLHPELLDQHRNKRAKRIQDQQVPQQHTLSTLDGVSTRFTAMLIIGATTLDGEDLHICQDSGASLNAIEISTAIKATCNLIPLSQPIVALMGNSSKLIANFKTNFTFKYGKSYFTAEYYGFEKLRFQLIIGNQFLFERLAIVIYEDPSTYLLDDEGEKVQFLCSIGELKGKIQKEYDLSTVEDTILYPLAIHQIQVYVMEKGNPTIPTFQQPTSLIFEDTQKPTGDEVFLTPRALVTAYGAQPCIWTIINKLDLTITIRQGSIIGKATLVSAEISSISFPDTTAPRSETQSAAPQFTEPYSIDDISSTHSSMPLLESIPSEHYDELPLPIPPHFAPRLFL